MLGRSPLADMVSSKQAPTRELWIRRVPGSIPGGATSLLDYCQRDTWAMVNLVERLRELAG